MHWRRRTDGDQQPATARRWPLTIAVPALVAALPYLVVACAALGAVHRPGTSEGDYAFIELGTRSALHGDALLGPYSRFGWNHPGPALFYWLAPFSWAFDQAPEALGVGAAVANVVAVVTCVVVAGLASGRRAAWLCAGGAVAMIWLWGYSWIDRIWNPFVILAPLLATGFLTAAVVAGRRWCAPALVAAASFVVQSHVGAGPVVALFAVAAITSIAISTWQQPRRWIGPILASLAVAAAAWALPLHEQRTAPSGNLGQLTAFARDSDSRHALPGVMDQVVVQLTLTKTGLISNVVSPTRAVPPATTGRAVLLAALVVVAALGIVGNRFRGRRFEQHLCLVALLGVGAVVYASIRVQGPLEGYLTLPATAMGSLLWAAAGLTVGAEAALLARRIGGPRAMTAAAVVVTVLALWSAQEVRLGHPERSLQVRRHERSSARAIERALDRAIPSSVREVRVVPSSGGIGVAGTIANQLELQGHPARVDRRYETFFGGERTSDGCETVLVRILLPEVDPDPARGKVVGTFNERPIQVERRARPAGCPAPDG